jgi:hypothetical protein
MAKHDIQTALRVPSDTLNRADKLIPFVDKAARECDIGGLVGQVRRSNILRLALIRGLEVLEAEHMEKEDA